MKTPKDLRSSATSRLKQLCETLDYAAMIAAGLELDDLDPSSMHSIRQSITLSQQYFHEFSAYSNALLTGELNADERSDVENKT